MYHKLLLFFLLILNNQTKISLLSFLFGFMN
nr:MAG TPA: hypothetical protein [Caudoviricetes sp.]